jgi:hypothetical protein
MSETITVDGIEMEAKLVRDATNALLDGEGNEESGESTDKTRSVVYGDVIAVGEGFKDADGWIGHVNEELTFVDLADVRDKAVDALNDESEYVKRLKAQVTGCPYTYAGAGSDSDDFDAYISIELSQSAVRSTSLSGVDLGDGEIAYVFNPSVSREYREGYDVDDNRDVIIGINAPDE